METNKNVNTEKFQETVLAKLQTLEENQAVMQSDYRGMRDTQTLIKIALIGNEEFGQPGLAKEFQVHVARDVVEFKTLHNGLEEQKYTIAKIIGAATAVIFVLELIFKK